MEHRLVLDTVNEVSRALLELVPWRAREGLDKLVSDTNERYKLVSDTIRQRVEEIDAAIQRSQQVSEEPLQGLLGQSRHCSSPVAVGGMASTGSLRVNPIRNAKEWSPAAAVAAGMAAGLSWCVVLGWDSSGAALCYPGWELLPAGVMWMV